MAFRNISFYKSDRNRLLELIYPDENVAIGKVVFKNSIFNGITARLWLDKITIIFSETLLIKHHDLIKTLEQEMVVLGSMCELKKGNKSINLIPVGKNNFEDSKMGMQLRAALYVLILDLSLKIIAKQLK
jgi:hypothetical protein